MKLFISLTILIVLLSKEGNAQWQQTNGPYGGTVNCIVSNGTSLFAGSDGNGIFYSSDNGSTWSIRNNGLTNFQVETIVFYGNTLLAGTGDGIFLSSDLGLNWIPSVTPLSSIRCIAVNGTDIFAGTLTNGMYFSSDGGMTWSPRNTGLSSTSVHCILFSGSTIFVGGAGLYKSINNGSSWSYIGMNSIEILCMLEDGPSLYAGINGGSGGVIKSINNWNTWTSINNGIATAPVHDLILIGSDIFAACDAVYVTNNAGNSWSQLNNGLTVNSVRDISTNNSDILVGTNSGGVFKSQNSGNSWSSSNEGIIATESRSIITSSNNIFCGIEGGIFQSNDEGNSWIEANSGLPPTTVRALQIEGSNFFAGTNSGVFLSTDNGNTWISRNSGLTNAYILSLAVNPGNLFAGTNGAGIYLSSDNGLNWNSVNIGLTNLYINCIAINGSYIYAGTNSGIFLSTNNGASWAPINNGLSATYIWSLIINGNDIIAGTNLRTFISSDNGSSWSPSNSGLPLGHVLTLLNDGTNIYAGTGAGVYFSSNSGANWNLFSTGMSSQIYALAKSSTMLYAATSNTGIWKCDLPTICSAPTIQSSEISFSNITTSQMTLSWLQGNGSQRMVVAKANATIMGNPLNGVTYSANTIFGSGDILNTDEFIIYNGTGSNATVTNLSPNTIYNFKIFESNCTPLQYLTSSTSNNPNSQLTASSCTAPTTQANGITFTSISTNQITVNWFNGNGTNRIVIAKLNSLITGVPTDGSTYSANSSFGNGAILDAGEFVVYNGIGSSVTVTNVSPNSTYHFRIYEYSCTPNQYLLTSANNNPNSQLTSSSCTMPTIQSSAITFNGISSNQLTVNWTNGNGTNRIVVAKAYNAITGNPVDGSTYVSNSVFGSGNTIGTGEFVVYNGTGSTITITNLLANTIYYFRMYEYSCSPTQYLITTANGNPNSQSTTSTVCLAPTSQSNAISFTGISTNQITLNWNIGDGTNRIVVAKANSAITGSPANSSTYNASATFGNGNTIGVGEYVVYNGTGSAVTINNLLANTIYYFRIYEYSCTPTQYLTTTAGGNPNNQNTSTSCSAPTSQSNTTSFSGVSTNQLSLNWINGNGTNRIVVAKANVAITGSPINGSTYIANSIFGSGSTIGAGEFVVYNGTGSTVTITNLLANTSYYFRVYDYSCSPTQYLTTTSSGNPNNQATSPLPTFWIGFYTKVENNVALSWEKLIAQGNSVMSSLPPAKICADGSKATVINLNCNDITIDMRKFKFRISGASDPSLYGSFVMNPISSTPVLAADTFQHPLIMDWVQTYRPMTLEIYNVDSPSVNIFTYPLEIYRAPVLFVHGLWGDKSTFQQMVSDFIGANMYPFYSPLIESSPLLYRVDYENSNDNSLGYNSMIVPLGINKILYQARDYNFSVGKVDLICHSMGGLLSRIYMEEIYSNQYRNDVHKFITLNTPHSGSQGANVLWNANGKELCRIITNNFTGDWICDDAIENMRVNSFDINNLLNNSSNLNKMVGIPSYSIATVGSGFNGTCPVIAISAILGLSELTVFNNEANDLVVALSSQYGGISPNNVFNNQCHIGSSKNNSVVNSVIALVNSIPDNTNFDLTGFTPPVLTSIFKIRKNQATVGSSIDSIEIISPSYGASIVSGGLLTCTITSTLNVDTIHFWASSGGYIYMLDTLCTGICTFSFNVPDSLNGKLFISVFSNDNSGNFIFDTTAVFVYPTANLDSIKLSPKSYFISTNEIVPVNVYGHYNDGISRNITHNLGVNFQILDTTLAWIAGNNEIQGKDTGTTQLIAYYQGFSDTLDLIVYLGEPWLLTAVDNNIDYTSNFIDKSRFLNVYPNPTNKNIFVKIAEPNSVTFELSIVDLLGNLMYKKEYINNLIDFETDIDISNFASGIYLIFVSSEQKKYFGKVIKN